MPSRIRLKTCTGVFLKFVPSNSGSPLGFFTSSQLPLGFCLTTTNPKHRHCDQKGVHFQQTPPDRATTTGWAPWPVSPACAWGPAGPGSPDALTPWRSWWTFVHFSSPEFAPPLDFFFFGGGPFVFHSLGKNSICFLAGVLIPAEFLGLDPSQWLRHNV